MKLARVKKKIGVTFSPAGSKSMTSVTFTPAAVKSTDLAPLHRHEKRLKSCMCYTIVYYAPRGRKGTLLTSTENTRVEEVPLPRGAYAIFYNTRVISDVF